MSMFSYSATTNSTRLYGRRSSAGFTLVEIMIALAIGLILISGMIFVFLGHKRTAALNEAVVEMQQSARFAFNVLARDIRMAGFQGCVGPQDNSANVLADTSPTNNLAATAIGGAVITAPGVMTPTGPIGFELPDDVITPVLNSHVLSVQFGSAETFQLDPMTSASAPVVLQAQETDFVTGDLVLISNCQVADIFQVSSTQQTVLQHDSSVNSGQQSLSATYGTGGSINRARAMRFESNVYFLADTGRTNSAGDPITSLYRQALPYTNRPLEIIESVADFQLRFTVRENNNELRYLRATDLDTNDAENIVGVQMGLLMQSYDRVTDTAQTGSHWLAGQLITPNADNQSSNRRLRMAFNSTVRVRNRR